MAKCKACGARIMWIPTEKGGMMPCDPKPIPYKEDQAGNLTLITSEGKVIKAKADATSESKGFVSHFATCPEADKFRKRGVL